MKILKSVVFVNFENFLYLMKNSSTYVNLLTKNKTHVRSINKTNSTEHNHSRD